MMETDLRRRRLLQQLLAGAALSLPLASGQAAPSRPRVLVLLELQGANDSLNTLVPYADPAYRRLRPRLAIAREQVIALDERRGLHPALAPLLPLWQAGDMAFVEGLGYASPNRSHFRSIDIWESASGADRFLSGGWLAPYLQSRPAGKRFIALGEDAGPLAGSPDNTLLINNFEAFVNNAKRLRRVQQETANPALRHLLSVQNAMQAAALDFARAEKPAELKGFGKDPFSRDMQTIASLISSQSSVGIYKLGLAGFDTHAAQLPRHGRLLTQLAKGLRAFSDELKRRGRWQDVLIMSYSEFGRRAAENGSAGTDHGTAAAHFLLGGGVRGGFYGESPSLTRLSDGDLIAGVDYRRYYRTVARDWLGFDELPLLKEHQALPGLFA
ncbi:DUF1501 domain-containing protein [Granulosicoccaceae sp. 1_MG-2023]|nr:DUF1501 domain-containing protein [Granulosicoccaceae sp. 1_MG-2023]